MFKIQVIKFLLASKNISPLRVITMRVIWHGRNNSYVNGDLIGDGDSHHCHHHVHYPGTEVL